MKFTTESKPLLTLLKKLAKIDRDPLAVVVIKIPSHSNISKIAYLTRQVAVYAEFDCQWSELGETCLPLRALITNLEGFTGRVEFTVARACEIKGAGLSAIVEVVPDIVWRDPPEIDAAQIDTDGFSLPYAIEQTAYVVDHDATRSYGQGVHFHSTGGVLTAVGSDGFRLSTCPVSGSSMVEVERQFGKNGVTIGVNCCRAIELFATRNSSVSVTKDKTSLKVTAYGASIYCRCMAIEYPEYQHVLPKTRGSDFHLNRKSAITAITAAVKATKDRLKSIAISTGEAGFIVAKDGVTAIIPHQGNLPGRNFVLNGLYLLEALKQFESEYVTWLWFPAEDDPIILHNETTGAQHVLLPIVEK